MCHYFRMKLGKDPQKEESEIGVGEGKIDKVKKKKRREKSNLECDLF